MVSRIINQSTNGNNVGNVCFSDKTTDRDFGGTDNIEINLCYDPRYFVVIDRGRISTCPSRFPISAFHATPLSMLCTHRVTK